MMKIQDIEFRPNAHPSIHWLLQSNDLINQTFHGSSQTVEEKKFLVLPTLRQQHNVAFLCF